MAKTVAATIEAMSQVGYDMTVLFGIPDFYHRFGYVRAWPLSSRSSSQGHCTAALLARRRSSGR